MHCDVTRAGELSRSCQKKMPRCQSEDRSRTSRLVQPDGAGSQKANQIYLLYFLQSVAVLLYSSHVMAAMP